MFVQTYLSPDLYLHSPGPPGVLLELELLLLELVDFLVPLEELLLEELLLFELEPEDGASDFEVSLFFGASLAEDCVVFFGAVSELLVEPHPANKARTRAITQIAIINLFPFITTLLSF